MSILSKVKKTIDEFGLVDKNQAILVGVSGGVDSIVLCHILLKLEYQLFIAHANFKLREEDSERDQEFVRAFSKKFNLEFISKELPISERSESIQKAAREKRYEWFKEICLKYEIDKIALGHNANDNFETALFHLIKGEGILNQRGIPIQAGRIIRPILFLDRREICEYANENNLSWRKDLSNDELKYSRNYLRNEVLPKIRELNPSVEKTYQRDYLRELDRREILFSVIKEKEDWLDPKEELINLNLKKLKLKKGWFLILETVLNPLGYSSEQYFELKKFLDSSSGKTFLIGEWQILMDRETLILSKKKSNANQKDIFIDSVPFVRKGENWTIKIDKCPPPKNPGKKQNHLEFIDAENLTFPLKLRPWNPGDRFKPLGMKGFKKISDLLIDQKVSKLKKNDIMVLESEGRIVLVPGLQISEDFKIKPQSKSAISIQFQIF